MATRTISTKLAVEGESEYKQAIASCNTELSTLKSSLALVESEFNGNANTVEALTAKGDALSAMYEKQQEKVSTLREALENAKAAQETYADRVSTAQENIERCEKALEELKNSTGDTSEEQRALTEELNKWNAELSEAQAYEAAAEKSVGNWEKQLNYAQVALNELSAEQDKNNAYLEEAKSSADGCASSIDEYGNAVKDAEGETSTFASVLGAGIVQEGLNKIQEYALKAGEALLSLGQDVADAKSTIVKMTGATGEALDELTESMKKVYAQVDDTDIQHTASAIGEVNTRLGVTGKELEEISYLFMEFADNTDTEVVSAIDGVVDVMKQWNVENKNTGLLLDKLTYAGQASGISITELTGNLTNNKAVLNQLGYSLDESIAFLAMLKQEGLNVSQVMTGFRTAINNITNAGGDAEKELKAIINRIASMGSASEATALAVDTFGSRAGAALADAIRAGRFEIEDWIAAIGEADGTLLRTAEAADTMEDKWNQALNSMKVELSGYTDELYSLGLSALPLVQSALGFIAEHAEGVASGIAGITTAVVSYKIAVGVATIATEAFGVALNSTGIGLVVGAIVGVTAAIATLALTMGDADEETKKLTEASREMGNVMDQAKTACDDTVTSTLAAASVADTYISKLEQMGDYASLSTEEQREYHNILALLCETVPELANYIDLETNTIEGGTEALRANTEAWKENAIAQAYQEEYTQLVSSYADVLLEAEKNSIGLARAQEELEAAQQKYNDALERMDQLTDDATEAAKAYNEENLTALDYTAFLSQEYYALRDSLSELANGIADAEQTVDTYNEAIKDGEDVAKAAKEEIALAEEAIRNLSRAQEEAVEPTKTMTDVVSSLNAEMEALQASYEESYNAAMESIEGQLGLFEELDGSAKTSIDNLIETLKGQVSYMETYAANIQKAMELGVDEGLVKKLSDGSEESAQILAAIVEGGEEDIAALNEQLAKVEEGKENFAQTVAEMETDFDEKMSNIEKRMEQAVKFMDAYTEARDAGLSTVQGYIAGANSMIPSLTSTFQSIAQAANNAYKSTLDINSPSRVFREHGKNTVRGAIEGVEEEKESFERVYTDLAEAAVRAYERGQPKGTEMDAAAIQREQTAALVAAVSTKQGGGAPVYQFHIDKMEVRDDQDVQRVAQELYYMTEREKRSRGGGSL